tara:strand:- start:558 stop:1484 length:927 start_codon:yes stop_codon:yes gene_type:complete
MKLRKPKFWDYKKPNIYAFLLYPITFLFNLISKLRIIQSKKKFKIKTICVGNFYIGGTGKTSLSIKLKDILEKKNIKSCFVKKFYKNQIDEQIILKNNGNIFISKSRKKALQEAQEKNYEVAILDDGLQDKSIKYDINIVCFNNINWVGNGMTIPSGPLRENINNLKHHQHIFLNGNLENIEYLKKEIQNINPKINIHLGKYKAVNIDHFNKDDNYLVFSGIGNHKTFISMLKSYGLNILKDIEFPDHYKYSKKDLNTMIELAKNLNCKIITTEKDYLRFKELQVEEIQYIKSKLEILDEERFIKYII